jgi:L-ascorbate metabolism protein UlaG (beta-lactamase superfamily)
MTTIANSIPGRRRFLETLVAAPMAATRREHPARAQSGVGISRGKSDASMRVQRLSWAGLKIEAGDTTVVIDPLHDASSADTITSAVPITIDTPLAHVLIASLTPEQAAAAADILRARILCPTHYGDNSPPSCVEADDAEKRVVQACRTRGVRVEVIAPGQWLTL